MKCRVGGIDGGPHCLIRTVSCAMKQVEKQHSCGPSFVDP